jgi:hypothetical protein
MCRHLEINTLLKNSWIKQEKNIWNTPKSVLRGISVAVKAYVIKVGFNNSKLLYFRNRKKRSKINLGTSRRK